MPRRLRIQFEQPPKSPFAAMRHGWILRSASFVSWLKAELPVEPSPRGMLPTEALSEDRPEMAVEQFLLAVADYDGQAPCDLGRVGEHAPARSIVTSLYPEGVALCSSR